MTNLSRGNKWFGEVNEDGSFSVLARITSLVGTGEEVTVQEGPCLAVADVSTITAKVFSLGANKNNQSGTEITPAPALTPATNIFNTLRTSGWPIDQDGAGYNFRFDVASTYVPDGGEWYKLEIKLTLTDGSIIWSEGYVKTNKLQTS